MQLKRPIMVIISSRVDETQALSGLKELASVVGVKDDSLSVSDSLFLKRTDLPLGDWSAEVEEVAKFLNSKLGKEEVHLALNVPAAFALALGIKISSSQVPPMCIYHFQTGTYHKVIDLTDDSRKLKNIKSDIHRIEAKFHKTGAEELAIILQFASHSSEGSVKKFLETMNLVADLLEIRHTSSGNVPLGDWSVEVSEIYSVIQKLRQDNYYRRFHLFLAVPVSIAFALGLALGTYVPLTIYQYNASAGDSKELYCPVFML
ncbi:SAVED domain-containing protein [Fervidobacterium thailandense]|uniref:SMODS-associated and fused to various effectors domain-containing protein n=1 Tax=Fervidobacterium thailandense TaxID=1008305 RepID=A0A1E3G3D5_9BACT|nr:SAVED domain-containing protein [Fervidobacterium thailandense]ODN30757.1 hypothetical protein A4H02_04320 [Fervidobacterium thailandense]